MIGAKVRYVSDNSDVQSPLQALSDTDRELIVRLVLASGSLKEVANSYGVSYPTIRLRLDRLIARLKESLAGRPRDPMAELLADLVQEGQMTSVAAKKVLELHRQEARRAKES
jgi:hypothetical protein